MSKISDLQSGHDLSNKIKYLPTALVQLLFQLPAKAWVTAPETNIKIQFTTSLFLFRLPLSKQNSM